jgi:N-acyl-phosphatidylethanolamine-hydrolysing phospholipase D
MDLPKGGVDVCMISHDHYDHLDYGTIESLVEKNLVKYWVVPLGIKQWLIDSAPGIAVDSILELEWWDAVKFVPNQSKGTNCAKSDGKFILNGPIVKTLKEKNTSSAKNGSELVITCAPSQHWCSRSPFDRNTRLWCSYAVHSSLHTRSIDPGKGDRLSFYFAGDTGYPQNFPLHRQIGDRLGPFDLAAIPIGAYKPRFFNRDSHCDPYEALKIHRDIQSRRSVPIHWGTFPLTNESNYEPPLLLNDAVQRLTRRLRKGFIEKHDDTKSNSTKKWASAKTHQSYDVDFVAIPHGDSIESRGIDIHDTDVDLSSILLNHKEISH